MCNFKIKKPMKTTLFIFMFLSLLFSSCNFSAKKNNNDESAAHNSKNSLDWAGIYSGTLPCADCAGMQTVVYLKMDGSFVMNVKHLGASDESVGTAGIVEWNKEGNTITLNGNDENASSSKYFVGEGELSYLDANGKLFSGDLADKYILRKADESLVERYWKLTELNGNPVNLEGRVPHIIFNIEGNRISGNGGCNSFFGGFETKAGNRITFSQIGATQMACQNLETESEFFKVLESADNYFVDGDKLVLNKARMAPLARFEAVVQ